MNQAKIIDQMLHDYKTIAVVGFSSNQRRAGYYVPEYLQQHGYRIIPINPSLTEELGEKAYPSLADIPEPIDLILVFRRPEHTPDIVRQAIAIQAKGIWLQLGIINEEAATLAREATIPFVMDACMLVEHQQRI